MFARYRRKVAARLRLAFEVLEDRTVPTAGALDETFGTGGKAIIPFSPGTDFLSDVVLLDDQKSLVAGGHIDTAGRTDFLVARLTASGQPDTDPATGFGPFTSGPGSPRTGFVTLDFGSDTEEWANALAVDLQGRIVVGGHTRLGSLALALARLNPDGSPDGTFGTGGKVVTDVSGGSDALLDLAVQADGKVVAVGYANNFGVPTSDFLTVRYTATGALDPTFAAGGVAVFNFGDRRHDIAYAVTVQSDGRILVGGGSSYFFPGTNRSNADLALLQYTTSGVLDPAFANGTTDLVPGTVFLESSNERITDLAVLPDGRIAASGVVAFDSFSGPHLPDDFLAAVFTSTGTLDGSFDGDGWRSIDFGGNADSAEGLAVQPDGELIIAGSTATGAGQSDVALVRLIATGGLDNMFGVDGKVTTDLGTSGDAVRAVALLPDGRIVAAGQAGSDAAAVRYEGGAPPRPDIIVTSLRQRSITDIEFAYATVGDPGPFEVGLYLSADESFDAGDSRIAAQTVTAGDTGLFHLDVPLSVNPAQPFVLVVADPSGLLAESDEGNNVTATRVDQPPTIRLGGTTGTQDDGQDQTFIWDITDPDNNLSSVSVEIRHDGTIVHTSTSVAGRFDFNSSGLGVFQVTVMATDATGATATESMMTTVVDDDTAPPRITLGGSLGTESESQAQSFGWSIADPSGLSFLSIAITRDTGDGPEVVFSSTDPGYADGTFNLDSYGPGTYAITVVTVDADGDRPEDSLSASAEQTVIVVPDGVRIFWRNRGGSQDRFDAVFGERAPTVRRVLDAAIDAWARVISSFNYASGPDTFVLDVIADPADPLNPAFGGGATHDLNGNGLIDPEEVDDRGMPHRGRLRIGGGDRVGSAGDSVNGWFIDPTPTDSSEFDAEIVNAFAGRRDDGVNDLFTVAVAELTHLMGLSSTPGLLLQRDGDPTRDGINGRNPNGEVFTVTNTGVPDDAEGRNPNTGATRGTFWVYQGSSVNALLTSNNGGPPPDGQDLGVPVHTAGVRQNGGGLSFNGVTVFGAEDAGNARYEPGTRYLPSNLDALILRDVYGYSVTMPETFGTFYSLLNQNTGELLVRGSAGDDVISIFPNGDAVEVRVDVSADVPGTGPTGEFVSVFPAVALHSIRIDTGFGGIDSVTLRHLGIPVDVSGGGVLADSLHVVGTSGDDVIVTTERSVTINGVPITHGRVQLTVSGGGGNDLFVVNGSQTTLLGGPGDDTFVVNAAGVDGLLLDGQGGSDDYSISLGQLGGGVTVADSGGSDTGLDAATVIGTAGDDTLVLSEGQVTLGSQMVSFTDAVERLIVDGAGGANRVVVEGELTVPTVWRNAAGAGVTNGVLLVVGTDGDDRVHMNEQGNGRLKVHAAFLPGGVDVFDTVGIERIHVMLGDGNDEATVSGGTKKAVILDGGAGNDTLVAGGGPSILLGGAGSDVLVGGGPRNLFIGGLGTDVLIGGDGEDILIGGTTAYDSDDETLWALLGVWVEGDGYADRVTGLRDGSRPSSLQRGLTVFDDDAPDRLLGNGGLDWFFFDPTQDVLVDRRPNEFMN